MNLVPFESYTATQLYCHDVEIEKGILLSKSVCIGLGEELYICQSDELLSKRRVFAASLRAGQW